MCDANLVMSLVAQDTKNAPDMVARDLTLSAVLMAVSQKSDGALVAAKAITIG